MAAKSATTILVNINALLMQTLPQKVRLSYSAAVWHSPTQQYRFKMQYK